MQDDGSDVDTADEDEEDEHGNVGRVLVFATRRNIELLCASTTWFLEDTFKTSTGIFAQAFTILVLRRRNIEHGEGVALPFVYTLLLKKTTEGYATLCRVVKELVEDFRVQACVQMRIMSNLNWGLQMPVRKFTPMSAHP